LAKGGAESILRALISRECFMSDVKPNPRAQGGASAWIWAGAVAVIVIALAGGGYWWMSGAHKTTLAGKRQNLLGLMGETVTELDNTKPDMDKMCEVTLKRALDFGVLPPGASLTSQDAQATQTEGHYTCQAQSSDGTYTLAIDTSCSGSEEKSCFALESVRRQDGIMTFQRRG
jgi:hypothetical protein